MAARRRRSAAEGRAASRSPLPEFITPELATLVDKAPGGEGWVHEIKLDGYRTAARIEQGQVRLLTRAGLDWTSRFRPIAAALSSLPITTAYLDGVGAQKPTERRP
jgi:bifunctional non-homologous end joining protein LigD